jgi:hypothetical protein
MLGLRQGQVKFSERAPECTRFSCLNHVCFFKALQVAFGVLKSYQRAVLEVDKASGLVRGGKSHHQRTE